MLNLNLKKWTSFIHMVFEMTKENKKTVCKNHIFETQCVPPKCVYSFTIVTHDYVRLVE